MRAHIDERRVAPRQILIAAIQIYLFFTDFQRPIIIKKDYSIIIYNYPGVINFNGLIQIIRIRNHNGQMLTGNKPVPAMSSTHEGQRR